MNDRICPDGTCPVRIGNRWVYMDDDHLPRDCVLTTVPFFVEQLGDRARGLG